MSSYTQDNRSLQITTPLGANKLLLAEFTGTEQISQLFRFDLLLWSEDFAIDPTSIVGKNVTFQVAQPSGTPRYYNGIVCRFSAGVHRGGLRQYRATVVPTLWLLTRAQDCRIFQNQSVPDIVKSVLDSRGVTNHKFSSITGSHPTLDYTVQYRETDFDFVSRLMEREGIFYYFEFQQDQHTLVLADSNATFQATSPSQVQIDYASTAQAEANRITGWEHIYEYRSGKWSQTDYNFIDNPAGTTKTPANELFTTSSTNLNLDQIDKYERYEYPGQYEQTSDGQNYSQARMQADEADYHIVQGASQCAFFVPGQKFTVDDPDLPSESGKKYVLISVTHQAQEGAAFPMTVAPGQTLDSYHNEFTCLPDEVNYRPPRRTPVPSVRGTQTAVVVGPSGEEIYPDKYGRVKVQFYWDRVGVRDENSSCWVRSAQATAGKNWGSMFIPRIGQEVVICFLDGNVDRPLITGVVYNADQMPAYPLPDEKTKSYIKTNSSTGGDGYNEIRFEDLADNEQIFVHAQRNLDLRVLNDRMENVLNDRHLIVGQQQDGSNTGSQLEQVYANKELHILGNHVEQIEGNCQLTIGKGNASDGGSYDLLIENKKTELVEGDNDFHLKGDQKQKIEGAQSTEVGGDRNGKVGGADSINVSSDRNQKVGGDESLDIANNLQQKVGQNAAIAAGQNITMKGGMNVVIEAGSNLTLKAGGSFVVIGADGVSIVGAMVKLNSGGSPGSGTAPSPTSPTSPDEPVDAQLAEPTDPTEADDSETGTESAPQSLN